MNIHKLKFTIFNKIIYSIITGIICIILPTIFWWHMNFRPLGLSLVVIFLSTIISIIGMVYGIKKVRSEIGKLAVIAIIINAISIINLIFVTQNWFLMGGITDFMDFVQ
jgi:hypothetical protein